MKADSGNKPKAPAPKKEEKDNLPEETGLFSKLRFPELPTKQAIGLPLVILFVSLLIIGYTLVTVNSPLHLGQDFKGGTTVTFNTDKTDQQLQSEFSQYHLTSVNSVGGQKELKFSTINDAEQQNLVDHVNTNYSNATITQTGSLISSANQGQAVIAIIIAFLGMGITVFVIFRNVIPSMAVVMSAFSDIMFAMAMMNLFHVELSFGTLAALIMLIGYSVDTDILLTTKVLGERKYLEKKISTCRTTGLTMTTAAIIAFLVLYIFSTFANYVGLAAVPPLSAIALVMIFGLIADVFNTWFFNAGLLKWYMESPSGRAKYG